MTCEEDYLTLTQVRARGWSPKLIASLLGEPDKSTRNPVYRTAAPTKLWRRSRVETAEQSSAFVSHLSKRGAMSARSRASADKKRAALLAEVEKLQVRVVRLPIERVLAEAIADWEARGIDRGEYGRGGSLADERTKQRWAVNYIRHALCSYDYKLEQVAGRIGVHDGVVAIRRKVYEAIAGVYPTLADECLRQADARGVPVAVPGPLL